MQYNCHYFSVSLPTGEGQDDVPRLLEHLARNIREKGGIDILDIVFSNDELDDNARWWPNFTVYYTQDTKHNSKDLKSPDS